MKRYLWNGVEYVEDPDGNVVFYDDLLQLLNKQGCNCQRELEQPTGIRNKDMMFYNAWICPAHGYKKL